VLEFEQGAAAERLLLQRRARTDRTWLMAERLAAVLRRQGFIPRVHFLERWLERARPFVRLDPATFRRQFQQARHYRQTRPGYRSRIAVIAGMPILYRMGGPRGRHVVLMGVLPSMPPVVPAQAPLLAPAREAESMAAFDSAQVRAICERARDLARSVPAALRDPLHPDPRRLHERALSWLAGTAWYWAWQGRAGTPGPLGRLTPADIDRLVSCLVGLERAIWPGRMKAVTRLRRTAAAELRRRGLWP
jgi:hypothetical protein